MFKSPIVALVVSLFLTVSCGSSDNDSNKNCTQPADGQLKGIRVPVTAPTSPTAPAQPNTGSNPKTNPATECVATPPANLDRPTVPGAPSQTPDLNSSNVNGQWSLVSEICENGVLSEGMKSTAEMLRDGRFSYQLDINAAVIRESVRVSFIIENAGTMMCSMSRTSALEKNGNELRLKSPASEFKDAGGDVACRLGSANAETVTIRQMQVQGNSLIIELPNTAECGGQSKVQIYSSQSF